MPSEFDDTICAIATPRGEGGIAVVRISGRGALPVASHVVRLRSGRLLDAIRNHQLVRADLLLSPISISGLPGDHPTVDTRAISDDALVVVMRAPYSYTGETVVEVHCHGGPLVVQLLCEALLRNGARLAEPGEFTKRAFLNGRLDLAQAEAVADTIRARTEASLRIAEEQLQGRLSTVVNGLRDRLVDMLAHVEAGIDFVEEDISFIECEELGRGLEEAVRRLGELIDSYRGGRVLRDGVTAAIVGRPNVGKSSVLNALLRADRAIVTPVPGTTRDVLEELVDINGVPVRLVDTAGIHSTDDPVEVEGIQRALRARERAELVLIVLDGSEPLTHEDRELVEGQHGQVKLVVVNKADLPQAVDLAEVAAVAKLEVGQGVLGLSAKTSVGLHTLRERITASVLQPQLEASEGVIVSRLRHVTALGRAKDGLDNGLQAVSKRLSGEFVAADLRGAVDALGEITGAVTTEDILDRVFSEFCIGK